MQRIVWTDLRKDVQNEIIRRLDNGERAYKIADEYGLHPPSLSRKYRKIKQRRNKDAPKPQRKVTTYATVKNDIQPKITEQKRASSQVIYKDANPLFDIKVLGEKDSMPKERNAWITTKRPLTILFFTDTHFGDHDQDACDAFIRVAATVKHDLIVHGGDALECYGLSKYGKDPRKIFSHSFKQEIYQWREFNDRLSDVTDAPKVMIFCNHMQRYYDWLMTTNNQSMIDLEEMELDYIMRLSTYGYAPSVNSIYFDGVEDIDFPNPFLYGHHGELSRKHSGTSSRAESENRGFINTFQGHVHRLSVGYKRTMQSQVIAIEGGTLRTLGASWMGFTDWQHGCVKIEYSFEDKYISGNPISIVNGKAFLDGVRV